MRMFGLVRITTWPAGESICPKCPGARAVMAIQPIVGQRWDVVSPGPGQQQSRRVKSFQMSASKVAISGFLA
jgi:hypothetical protein